MAKQWTAQQLFINSVSRLRASGQQVPLTSAPAGRWGGREDRPRDENHKKKDHKAVQVPLHPRHPHVCWRSRQAAVVKTSYVQLRFVTTGGGRPPLRVTRRQEARWLGGRWRGGCVCRLQESGWMLSGVAGQLLWADGSQDWCSSLDWTCRCSRHTSIREGGDRQRRTHPPTIILPLLSFPPLSPPHHPLPLSFWKGVKAFYALRTLINCL